jgi:tetratricopeptide (TPR) repeat protein
MSDENEGPPPMPPQLHEFLEAHQKTGEPTQAELGHALLRLHGATRPSLLARTAVRRFLPPEVMAVAAVLVLSVGGAFIGWRVRTANAQTEALSQAKAAWVRGDLEAASAAFEACSTAECARLAAAVKRAKLQSANLEGLDAAEEGSLLALDRELSQGERSVLADRLDQKPQPGENDRDFAMRQLEVLREAGVPMQIAHMAVGEFIRGSEATDPDMARSPWAVVVKLVPDTELARAAQKKLAALEAPSKPPLRSPEPLTPQLAELLERATKAKKEQQFDKAVGLLEQCLKQAPDQPECVVTLASTLASRGSRTNDADDNRRAQAMYTRFLEVADMTDKRRARVEEILSADQNPSRRELDREPLSEHQVTDFAVVGELGRISEFEKTDPAAAMLAYEELLRVAPQSSSAVIARIKLAELVTAGSQPNGPSPSASTEAASLYERGVALKDSAPDEARALFEAAIASAPTSLEASKARLRIQFLDDRKEAGRKRALQARDVYLRAYQVREADPAGARALFEQVIELSPDSVEAEKARNRLEELDASPSEEIIQEEEERGTTLTLAINERRTIVIKGIRRVAIGDSETADVRTLGNDRLEVRGLSPGKTTLLVWTGDGKRVAYVVSVIRGTSGARGQLKIASNPTQATIIIDGKSTGRNTPVLPIDPLEVPVGRHTIEFEWNGKRSAVQKLDVVEGANPVIKGEIPQ